MHVNGWALSNYFARGRTVSWGQRDRTGNPVATAYRAGDDKLFCGFLPPDLFGLTYLVRFRVTAPYHARDLVQG